MRDRRGDHRIVVNPKDDWFAHDLAFPGDRTACRKNGAGRLT
jgi:hypothetical protein